MHKNYIITNFFPCSFTEVCDAIGNLRKNGSEEDISGKFLKMCKLPLGIHLYTLFDMIFESGVFPEKFKIPKVTSIHKKGSKFLLGNYRPIDILSNFSKILKEIFLKRL